MRDPVGSRLPSPQLYKGNKPWCGSPLTGTGGENFPERKTEPAAPRRNLRVPRCVIQC